MIIEDYTAQVRLALQQASYIRNVLLHSVALLEQLEQNGGRAGEMRPAWAPPSLKKVTNSNASDRVGADEGDSVADPLDDDPRSQKLRELHACPPSAKFTPTETALYLNTTPALLRSWRWKKCGPEFEGSGRFIRYLKGNLDRFVA